MLTLVSPKLLLFGKNYPLNKEKLDFGATLTEYQENVNEVTNYCALVKLLPTIELIRPADWYNAKFINTYSVSKTHTTIWLESGGLLDQLNAVPVGIVDYDTLYKAVSDEIISHAEALKDNPSAEETELRKKLLKKSLLHLKNDITSKYQQVKGVQARIEKFSGECNQYNNFFNSLYKNSSDTKQVNGNQITVLTSKAKELNDRIAVINKKKMDLAIAMGSTGLIIVVSLMFGPFAWIVTLFVGGAALIAEGVEYALADAEVSRLLKECADIRKEMDDRTKDALVLKNIVEASNNLAKALDSTKAALEKITSSWKTLEDNCSLLVKELAFADLEREKQIFEELIKSMKTSDGLWNAIVSLAKQLELIQIEYDTSKTY